MIRECPFCEEGCCFCDYSGSIKIGESQVFGTIKTYEEVRNTAECKAIREETISEQSPTKENK